MTDAHSDNGDHAFGFHSPARGPENERGEPRRAAPRVDEAGIAAVSTPDRRSEIEIDLKVKPPVGIHTFATGAVRSERRGKGRFDLLPFEGLRRIAIRYEGGAEIFGARNWEMGMTLSELMSSAIRHATQAADGQTDEDHFAAAGWNILGAMHVQREIQAGRLPAELDDLPRRT